MEIKSYQIELEDQRDWLEKYKEDLSTANSSLYERDEKRKVQIKTKEEEIVDLTTRIEQLEHEIEKVLYYY
jgi:vacuolar-type H+-ATPase subunit I/STV1